MFYCRQKILSILCVLNIMIPTYVCAEQTPNPRSSGIKVDSSVDNTSSVRRSATSVIARSTSNRKSKPVTVVSRNNEHITRVSKSKSDITKNISTKNKLNRSANNIAVANGRIINNQRNKTSNVSRSARATAVFNDVSKIGGGYSECRDSYATCMDQLCANANDTYRRCFCSDRFTSFRDTSDALDSALAMLADFQNNNLSVVDKTAAEVSAMYSASDGEKAIKKDTSASQKMLDNISNILSGKKDVTTKTNSSNSLGVLDLSSFSVGVTDDIWNSDSTTSSLFGDSYNNSNSLADLEGQELYTNAHKQCMNVTRNVCSSDAMFNLAKSAYSIMITQDCNSYEKNINAKKTSVEETVRTAEKYLREARLEEYKAHNSQDVNECLAKVENAIKQSTACGENYAKCLDYTGMYINASTGEPIYTKALFNLNNLIVLDGTSDVLSANPEFVEFLEEKKMFVTTALDSCRNIADTVWNEFKRSALIQIAQAQDEKIEEVKNSCVTTMKECYDTQTDSLEEFGSDSYSSAGAISVVTAHDMCKDKVLTCAALYGDPNGCTYDDKTKKITDSGNGTCGLKSLLAYVNTIDSVAVANSCETSLNEYIKDVCAPASSDSQHVYPWGCRELKIGQVGDYKNNSKVDSIYGMLEQRASVYCAEDLISGQQSDLENDVKFNVETDSIIKNIVTSLKEDMATVLSKECLSNTSEGNVIWDANGYSVDDIDLTVSVSPTWLSNVYGNGYSLQSLVDNGVSGYNLVIEKTGKSISTISGVNKSFGWGICMLPTTSQLCNMQLHLPGMESTAVEYDSANKTCILNDGWYEFKCISIGGYWKGNNCYIQ